MGFLIGGGSVSGNPGAPGHAWMVEVDPQGTLIWSTVIDGTTDPGSDKITAVVNRLSTFNGVYECYGSAACNSGITVYKLDETGVPFSVNFAGSNDEFVYNSGSSSNTWPVDMTYNQIGSTYDEGLHIFGNLDITGPGNHYFVQAYFSGEEGCNTPITLAAYDQTNPSVSALTDSPGSLVFSCPSFDITASSLNPYNAICGPVSSIGGASNNKMTHYESKQHFQSENMLDVYPNPVKEKITLSYNVINKGVVKIDLYNSLGQLIKSLINLPNCEPGNYTSSVDFTTLDLPNGVYFLNTNLNGGEMKQKLIYSK